MAATPTAIPSSLTNRATAALTSRVPPPRPASVADDTQHTSIVTSIITTAKRHKRILIRTVIWAALWRAAIAIEFGVVYLIASGIYFIFTNLSSDGRRSADGTTAPSAYAAFNNDGYKMSGSMDADQFDAQLRHAPARVASTQQALPAMARPGAAPTRMMGTGRVLSTGAAVISSTNENGATTVDYKRKSKMANQPV